MCSQGVWWLCVVGGVVVMCSQGVWWLCVVRGCGGYV